MGRGMIFLRSSDEPLFLMGRDTLHSCFMTETMIEAAATKDDQWSGRESPNKSTADCL